MIGCMLAICTFEVLILSLRKLNIGNNDELILSSDFFPP